MSKSVLAMIFEERDNIARLDYLLTIKDKSSDQIKEQNKLVEKYVISKEVTADSEAKELIDTFMQSAKDMSEYEVDFIIGLICGMTTRSIATRDYSEDKKELFIRENAKTILQLRKVALETIKKNRHNSTGHPRPVIEV